MRNLLASIGAFVVVSILVFWGLSYSKEAKLAAAQTCVSKSVDKLRSNADSLDAKAREYKVEAKKYEFELRREQASVDQLKEAIEKLAKAAKEAGLPKFSEGANLTDEQANVELTFGDKRINAREVYNILQRWNGDYKTKSAALDVKKKTIERLNGAAEQIMTKKNDMTGTLVQLEDRVQELKSAKDIAKLNEELSEIEAAVKGVDVGEYGEALKIVQEQIDEFNARADVYQTEAQTKKTELNPIDVLEPTDSAADLDKYWN